VRARFGYRPRQDRNTALREKIVSLAQRHRRYGAEMIYLKLRQAGELVNHKRVERLYTLEALFGDRRTQSSVRPS
jgi:putative transposase